MKTVTRALIIGLIVMTAAVSGNQAIARATAKPAQTDICCDPGPCPGGPMCPLQ